MKNFVKISKACRGGLSYNGLCRFIVRTYVHERLKKHLKN